MWIIMTHSPHNKARGPHPEEAAKPPSRRMASGNEFDAMLRGATTHVGCRRLALQRMPMSGKPDIGGRSSA
jgi:hypothetical protein